MEQNSGILGTRAWQMPCPFVPLPEQKGITDSASRSSQPCCTDKSPLTPADLRIAQTWHWWLSTCSHSFVSAQAQQVYNEILGTVDRGSPASCLFLSTTQATQAL